MITGNHRQHHKIEELPDPNGPATSSYPPPTSNKRKWSNVLPIFVGLVVIGEIAFLGRLDMVKNADLVNSWAESFYEFTQTSPYWSADSWVDESGSGSEGSGLQSDQDSCQAWLEREDYVPYSRDFKEEPVLVQGAAEEWKTCAVGCKFGYESGKKPDAAFGFPQQPGTAAVLRSMESAKYYSENNIDNARRWEGI